MECPHFFLRTLRPRGRSETKRAAFCAALRHLASSVEARAYSSRRLRLVALGRRHTPAGARTIVSDQGRGGPQIKTLSIAAPSNLIPDCSRSPTHVEPRNQPGKNGSLPFVGRAAVLSSSMRRRSTCQQRGGNRDGALSLRGLLKGRLCKDSNKEKKGPFLRLSAPPSFQFVSRDAFFFCVCGVFQVNLTQF